MAARTYFLTAQELKDSTYLDDNVEDKDIYVAMTDAQEQILEPVLGSALYEKIYDDITNKTITTNYQNLCVDFLWPILYQATVYKLSYNLLFHMVRSSVVKDDNDNSQGVSIQDLNVIIKERELSMNYHIKKLKDHLLVNQANFPEYTGTQPTDGQAPDMTENLLSFWNWEINL